MEEFVNKVKIFLKEKYFNKNIMTNPKTLFKVQ